MAIDYTRKKVMKLQESLYFDHEKVTSLAEKLTSLNMKIQNTTLRTKSNVKNQSS